MALLRLEETETETAPATEEAAADTAMAGEAEEAAEEVVVITLILPTIVTVEEEVAAGDVAVPAEAGAEAGVAGQVQATASPPVGLRVSIPRLPCSAS